MTIELTVAAHEVATEDIEPDDTTDYASPIATTLDERHRLAAEENTRQTRIRMKEMIAAAAAKRCGSIDPSLR